MEDNVCRGKDVSIEIDSDVAALELSLTDGWESRYYMEKSRLPVLEVLIKDNPAEIQTVIRLSES